MGYPAIEASRLGLFVPPVVAESTLELRSRCPVASQQRGFHNHSEDVAVLI